MSDVGYDPLRYREGGFNYADRLFSGVANQQAGRRLASGDATGAANTLLRSGDLGGGMALQDRQRADQERQRAEQDRLKAQQVQTTLQVVRAMRSVRDQGGDIAAEIPKYRGVFEALGVPGQEYDATAAQLVANPAFLDQAEVVLGQQARELEIQNLGGGYGVAIDKATGEVVNEYRAPVQPMNVNGVLIDPETREVVLDTREPKYQTITNSDGSTQLVAIDQPAPVRGAGAGTGDVGQIIEGILEREGGFVASDGRSGAPANFGINQRANPDINVRNLTRDQAAQIYQDRYVAPVLEAGVSGPALEAVIDFGVNAGVGRSLDFWRRSGGDIDEFNRLRLAHYRSLPDYDRNGRSWERRVAETTPEQRGAEVPVQGGARVVAAGQNFGPTPAQRRQDERAARQEQQGARRDEVNLRREFNNRQEVKDFRTIESAYNSVRSAAANPSAAGDLSLIFAYMKILDPGSVVREQEFANAQNAAGVPDRVRNLYNRALNGQRLNPNQRRDFVNQAEGLYQSRRQTFDTIAGEYRSYAQDYGVSPDRVVRAQERETPLPAGRQRLRFTPTEQQTAVSRRIAPGGRTTGQRGQRTNPILINPADPTTSYGNVRSGQYFITPDGQVRRKP